MSALTTIDNSLKVQQQSQLQLKNKKLPIYEKHHGTQT